MTDTNKCEFCKGDRIIYHCTSDDPNRRLPCPKCCPVEFAKAIGQSPQWIERTAESECEPPFWAMNMHDSVILIEATRLDELDGLTWTHYMPATAPYAVPSAPEKPDEFEQWFKEKYPNASELDRLLCKDAWYNSRKAAKAQTK